MTFPEYESYDAMGLAELVRRKEVSAAELVEAAIERLETRDPKIGAIVTRMYDEGRQAVAAIARRFHFASRE